MPKILLSGVIGPEENLYFNLEGDRLMRDQDIFTPAGHFHYIALHFLAQNISTPCVLLEHPTIEDLEEELKKGYDFIGINFTLVNILKLIEMCSHIRAVAPDTKIILGGYGTSCFSTIFKGDAEIRELADYICHGEGVAFLRRILGEPIDAPINQTMGPRGSNDLPWLHPYPSGKDGTGFIVSGLGCTNMCEFCCTSHYYGGEYIEIDTADHMFESMKEICHLRPDAKAQFSIFDENFFKNKDKVDRLGKRIREDKDTGLDKVSYFGFGAIEDLSRYDVAEELLMNGVGAIWIGVESLFSKLPKRQGRDPKELFDDLHAHGITTIGSWIGGWDFHDKENIQEDLEYFISLSPTSSQLLPLIPPPGTSLYEKLISEDRLPEIGEANTYFGRTSGANQFGFPDWRKNFTEEEISAVVESGHRRLYEHAGPTYIRELRTYLNGYRFCKKSSHEALHEHKSQFFKERCLNRYPLIKTSKFFAPNEKVRKHIQQIQDDYYQLIGEPTPEQEVMSNYIFLKGCLAKMTSVVGQKPPPGYPFRRYEYDRRPKDGKPYQVSYPHKDERYEFEMQGHEKEMKLLEGVIHLVKEGKQLDHADEQVRQINEVFENLETLGNLAKLLENVGDNLGFSKSWLKFEVEKQIGSDSFFFKAGATIQDDEEVAGENA